MNKQQRTVLWVAVAMVILAGLFPPWWTTDGLCQGYAPVFVRPEIGTASDQVLQINIVRLAVEWVTIVLATVGFVLALGHEKAR